MGRRQDQRRRRDDDPLALAQLISRRRAPVARKIYEKLGGGSPLLAETSAQAAAIKAQQAM